MGFLPVFFFFLFLVWGKRTLDFAFVSLCYGRSGEDMCRGYAMAASGRMQYDYKQTNTTPINVLGPCVLRNRRSTAIATYHPRNDACLLSTKFPKDFNSDDDCSVQRESRYLEYLSQAKRPSLTGL
jgi:hypothetical protein